MGPNKGEYKILRDDEKCLMKKFLDSFKDELGKSSEEKIAEDRNTNREACQRLRDAEKQLQQDEKLYSQKYEKTKELEVLGRKMEQVQSKIDAIHDEYGWNLDMKAELSRLNQMKKNYETDFGNKKKEWASLTKQTKNTGKEKAKVDRIRASLTAKESEKNAMEERLNQTKPLDDLKEHESELQRQNEEDQEIIQDENALSSDKEAAEGRVAERNDLRQISEKIGQRCIHCLHCSEFFQSSTLSVGATLFLLASLWAREF